MLVATAAEDCPLFPSLDICAKHRGAVGQSVGALNALIQGTILVAGSPEPGLNQDGQGEGAADRRTRTQVANCGVADRATSTRTANGSRADRQTRTGLTDGSRADRHRRTRSP